MSSAIVLVTGGSKDPRQAFTAAESGASSIGTTDRPHELPMACVEVLGSSILARMTSEFRRIGVDEVSLLIDEMFSSRRDEIEQSVPELAPVWTSDLSRAVAQTLAAYKESGIETCILTLASVYAEFDLSDALQFHRAHQQPVTRVLDGKGLLDFWVVKVDGISEVADIFASLQGPQASSYIVSGYVRRLEHLRDLRCLVVDSLTSRCRMRPQGFEVRPGVWLAEGVQVHRRARIVAPAFLGSATKIEEQCLITRCSNVESNSQVDFGTVVEDSSVLSNSYIGMGLDLTHSVVDGSRLLNLRRDVMLEIKDPGLIGPNKSSGKDANSRSVLSFGMDSISARRERRSFNSETESTYSLL